MSTRSWLRGLCALAALTSAGAFATAPGATAPLDSETALQHVQARKAEAYRDVLARFDMAMLASPDDVTLGVARCDFINRFTDEEYGEWVDSAPDDFQACTQTLQARWPRAPEAQLFALEQVWGEEAVEAGEKLLPVADAWPAPLRARLLARLSEAHANEDNDSRAGELAVQAAAFGDHTRTAIAVKHLASRGEFASAAKVLQQAPPAESAWQAGQRIKAAVELPDARAALQELRRYAKADFEIDATIAARAYLRAGDLAAARKVLMDDEARTSDGRQVHFDVALAVGDFKAAAALVDMTDMDALGDNLLRFLALLKRSPAALFSGPMMLGVLVGMLILGAVVLLPAVLFMPVHYRGLVRRAKGQATTPLFESIGLRKAWIGTALMLIVPTAVGLLVDPQATLDMLSGRAPTPAGMFQSMLWGTVAGLACVVVLLRPMEPRQLLGDRAALRAIWWVLLAWGGLVATAVIVAKLGQGAGGTGGTNARSQALNALAAGGLETVGPWGTLLLVAVLVPLFEELTFRGLVLGGLARHVSFGWANTIQAALFAVIHDDPPRIPFYFVLGLLAGWLVRKTRSLGPAIALHALNNALAFSARVF